MAKIKAIVVRLTCNCGKSWTAAFTSGKIHKTAKCPSCSNFIKTDGSSLSERPAACRSCNRPVINVVKGKPAAKDCTYCGEPLFKK